MTRLVRAEIFKLRTTNTWWLFALATLISTIVTLVINCLNARSLLKPFAQYVVLQSHDHRSASSIPPDFLAHLRDDWTLGHNPVTQASTIFTSGQLLGVLIACLLGIILITSEYYHQTATTTFLLTPHRTAVVVSKLITAILMAGLFWLVSTAISLITGFVFLHSQGYGSQLGHWDVVRSMLLNLAAYAIWAVFGIGLGALIRSQLGATITATVLYLVGAAAAGSVFDLLNTYVIKHDWILAWQVVVPAMASTIMISPTKPFTQSPSPWVGAAVLISYGIGMAVLGTSMLRKRDVG